MHFKCIILRLLCVISFKIGLFPSNFAMAQQEHSSEINTSHALKKTFLQSTIASFRNIFVFTKTLPFIGGLVASYKFVEIAVESTFMDYLIDSTDDQRIAAIITNLYDALSSILFVFVSLVAEAYMGCFTTITLCAAASIQGLMLLWTYGSFSVNLALYAAFFFLALGKSGQNLSENFLEYQLEEKIKVKKERELENGSRQNKKEQNHVKSRSNFWLFLFHPVVGYVITVSISLKVNDDYIFRAATLLMGGTLVLFLFGYVGYRRENLSEGNLRKIYRIYKAAFGKRKSKYPTSPSCYYLKGYKQKRWYYKHGKCEELRLYPKVPRLFRWLDKAAIIEGEESSDPEAQEKKGKLCMVKEVREVKSLVPMMYLCFSFFACSLLLGTGNTFFVAQANNMKPMTDNNGNDIWVLFLIMSGMNKMSRFICFIISFSFRRPRQFKAMDGRFKIKRNAGTIIRVAFGMFCAVICSLVAWKVEARRLKVNKENDHNHSGRNNTVTLIPQFALLGTSEGLVDGGLEKLFLGHVMNSMWSFEDSYSELVIGSGKLLIIPVVLIFSNCWFKKKVNDSRLDIYYLMLGIFNAAFLVVFGYYSVKYACGEACLGDEEVPMEHTHEPVSQDSLKENDHKEQPQVERESEDFLQENDLNEQPQLDQDRHEGNDENVDLSVLDLLVN
ncbi:hypothetical protein Fmac_012269 [Flemingia macrophylla]|uniref:Uncharacterized protein n=1 Tax=Flemingia macrophylla TaxID=520843 RepID=A0ABD1MPV7_9FABA